MALVIGAITKVTVAGTAASGALPGTSGNILLSCNTDCYVRFDGDTASASAYDLFMPAGSSYVVRPKSSGAASVIWDSAAGVLSMQEIE